MEIWISDGIGCAACSASTSIPSRQASRSGPRGRRHRQHHLALFFLARYNAKHGKQIEIVPKPAMAALEAYDWPGNVRELENLIERCVILTAGNKLWFDTALLGRAPALSRAATTEHARARPRPLPASDSESLRDVERAHITAVLEDCGWKVKGAGNAAERLGLKESTLRSRMKKLGIRRPHP